MQSTVVILGARGRFGWATAMAFRAAGWRVLGQTRPGAALPGAALQAGIERLGINLNDTAALARASRGASVVVHALNPSAYTFKAWRNEVLPMTDAAIDLARALDATLMVPGNVYNFGAQMPAVLRENTPQRAETVKGQIRIAMEERLQGSGQKAVVIRAGDFFGSGKGSWFDMFVAKNLKSGRVTYPGQLDVPTAWAYLPDLARTFVAVAERRDSLPQFEQLHFGGYSLTGQNWLDALTPIARAQAWLKPVGVLKVNRLPWAVIRLASPLVPTWASLMEMRYLWDTPHALANDQLTALIGAEPKTAFDIAVMQSLVDLGLMTTSKTVPTLVVA
jgi:nucleoside-diphosphate-sugar epimerase